MADVIIYHNPRCTKSRETLQLLEEKGIKPQVIEYLKNPPTPAELDEILKALKIEPDALVRKKEDVYKELGLAGKNPDRKTYLKILSDNPILIERPIVMKGKKAALGRPPEKVLDIL